MGHWKIGTRGRVKTYICVPNWTWISDPRLRVLYQVKAGDKRTEAALNTREVRVHKYSGGGV